MGILKLVSSDYDGGNVTVAEDPLSFLPSFSLNYFVSDAFLIL